MSKPNSEDEEEINSYKKQRELLEASNYYHYTRIRNIPMQLFSISSQGKSAQDELENLLYNHSYCVE
jgi:hypothetical protein